MNMAEKISLTKPDSYRSSSWEIIGEETFSEGGAEAKKRVKLKPAEFDTARTLVMVERGWFEWEDYYRKWLIFNKAGLPVTPTLRKSDRGTVFLTDVKADGSNVYGGSLSNMLASDETVPTHNLDSVFINLVKNHFEEITLAAEAIAGKATANRIQLPSDQPFELLLHPDNSWELITLDLRRAEVSLSKSEIISLTQVNKNRIELVLNSLKQLGTYYEKASRKEKRDLFSVVRRFFNNKDR